MAFQASAASSGIRTPRLENARFLLPYRRQSVSLGRCHRLLERLATVDAISIGDLLRAAFITIADQQTGLPCLWHLVATGRIAADLDRPLTMTSLLRAA